MNIKQSSIKLVAYTALNPELFSIDTDMLPILAARVSHDQDDKTGDDLEADLKLMNYLAKHKHMSVFEHMSVTFAVECPIFVAREWMRHRTQSFNEISARYTSSFIGDVWMPDVFRAQATRNKQSSEGQIENQDEAKELLSNAYDAALCLYDKLIALGVAREIARAVMPVGHMTRFYATSNIRNWKHFCDLRCAPDAQQEIRELANKVSEELTKLYPNTWSALNKE